MHLSMQLSTLNRSTQPQHQSTHQMRNGGSGLRSEERRLDGMIQNEKEDGSKNDDLHENQNPLTLLGSQKSLQDVHDSSEHFRLKNLTHKQKTRGSVIASDVEEEDPSGTPIPGFQARKTIILSSKDLPPMNFNQVPSQNTNQFTSLPNSNRVS